MVLSSYWVVKGGIKVVSAGIRPFQVVSGVLWFSKYGMSQCWLRFDVLIFV